MTLSVIECCVGILSACLPTYRPLWRKYGYAHTKRRAIANDVQCNEVTVLNRASEGSLWAEGTPWPTDNRRGEGSYTNPSSKIDSTSSTYQTTIVLSSTFHSVK